LVAVAAKLRTVQPFTKLLGQARTVLPVRSTVWAHHHRCLAVLTGLNVFREVLKPLKDTSVEVRHQLGRQTRAATGPELREHPVVSAQDVLDLLFLVADFCSARLPFDDGENFLLAEDVPFDGRRRVDTSRQGDLVEALGVVVRYGDPGQVQAL
jgi:hypothetical protein